jgi:hypothetical protein
MGGDVKRLRTDQLRYGHSPDKRGERTDKYGRQPIEVDRSGKVVDGNDRLYYARQRGDRHINAVVVSSSGGCLVMTLFVAVAVGLIRKVKR